MTRSSDTDRMDEARLRVQYLRANEALADEEAPSPAVRAAVLAAAARQVQGRPQAVGARPRWRVPLAAAASVLVGTLAVVLATRHDDSTTKTVVTTEASVPQPPPVPQAVPQPQTDPPTLAQRAPAPAPADAGARAEAAPAAAPTPVPPRAVASAPPAVVASPAAPRAQSPAVARAERPAQPDMQVAAAPPPEAGQSVERSATERRAAELAAPAPAAPPPPPTAGSNTMSRERASDPGAGASADAAAVARTQPRAAAPAASAAAAAPTAEQQVKARPVQRTAPMADSAGPTPLSTEEANRWITRVVELRRAGRDAEADAELKALRERAPTLPIPPAALSRIGSR